MSKLEKLPGSHVMVIDEPELTGVILQIEGDRILVELDSALDSLTVGIRNHGWREWYDTRALSILEAK